MNENTPAEAGTGELNAPSLEFGSDTMASYLSAIAAVGGPISPVRAGRLRAAAEIIAAHRCSSSVVPGDTATEGGDGFMAWLDMQIVDAEGTRAEVAEDFPDAVGVNDADLAYARERAFREVRERFAAAGLLVPAGTGGEAPRRGGAVEVWLKARRDRYDRYASPHHQHAWDALDEALDDLRERADTGAPWSGRMVDYGDGRPQHEPDDDLSVASPQGEAQGQGEDAPELWWSPSGGVLRSAPDGAWRMRLGPEPAAPVPDDAVRLVAAPRAAAPVGNEREDAKALLVEIGTEVLGLTREQVIEDPRLVRDYAAKAVGSRNMANATLKRRAEGLRAALGAPEDTPWPQLIARVQAPVGDVDREALVQAFRHETARVFDPARAGRERYSAWMQPTDAEAERMADVALAALRGDR